MEANEWRDYITITDGNDAKHDENSDVNKCDTDVYEIDEEDDTHYVNEDTFMKISDVCREPQQDEKAEATEKCEEKKLYANSNEGYEENQEHENQSKTTCAQNSKETDPYVAMRSAILREKPPYANTRHEDGKEVFVSDSDKQSSYVYKDRKWYEDAMYIDMRGSVKNLKADSLSDVESRKPLPLPRKSLSNGTETCNRAFSDDSRPYSEVIELPNKAVTESQNRSNNTQIPRSQQGRPTTCPDDVKMEVETTDNIHHNSLHNAWSWIRKNLNPIDSHKARLYLGLTVLIVALLFVIIILATQL